MIHLLLYFRKSGFCHLDPVSGIWFSPRLHLCRMFQKKRWLMKLRMIDGVFPKFQTRTLLKKRDWLYSGILSMPLWCLMKKIDCKRQPTDGKVETCIDCIFLYKWPTNSGGIGGETDLFSFCRILIRSRGPLFTGNRGRWRQQSRNKMASLNSITTRLSPSWIHTRKYLVDSHRIKSNWIVRNVQGVLWLINNQVTDFVFGCDFNCLLEVISLAEKLNYESVDNRLIDY